MDVLLSALRPAMQGRTALCDSSYRVGITADGYVPGAGGDGRLSARHDRHQGGGQLQRNDRAEGSPVSLGLTLANLGLQFAGIATVLYMSARMTHYMLQLKDRETQEAARSLLRAKLPARRDIDMDSLDLNAHEISVVMDVVASSSLVTTFDMIGGLGDMKQEIMDIVTLACSREAQLQGVTAPRGMLLSGVPGTGKTMLAQAIAKQSGATFINVRMGAVQQKYVGEGEKMVAAIFSLANKLAPSIIFIDEIDCCLRTRTGFEHDHVLRVKTEFMTLWDGLLTERSRPVMVLGTTNRPADVDPAILRRLPRQFVVALPERSEQREHILRLIARKYQVAEEVDLRLVADQTAGFSGSDLDALFQAAQTIPAREFARALRLEMRARALTRAMNATANEAPATPAAAAIEPSPLRRSVDNVMSLLRDANREVTRLLGEAGAMGGGEDGPELQAAEAEAAAEAAEGEAAAEASITRAQMRAISESDFIAALRSVRPTGQMAMTFEMDRATQRRPHEQ